MIYLTKHQTQAAYDAVKDNLAKPQVALIEETNKVAYQPYVPRPSHDYVEIAGIKWATMNIGAENATDYGLLFQWGDTQGYTATQVGVDKTFNRTNYKYYNGGTGTTKYNSTDGKTVLDLEDDAVNAAWGGNWRMPTREEFKALSAATTSVWTDDYEGSGVSGLIVTDKTDNSKVLFFPAAGDANHNTFTSNRGSYWSSIREPDYGGEGSYGLRFGSNFTYWSTTFTIFNGLSARGILDE